METKELVVVDQKKLAGFIEKAEIMRTDIRSLQVNSLPKYKICISKRDIAKAFQKTIITYFQEMKASALKTHRLICKEENDALAPHIENVRIADGKASTWYQEEQRKAEEKARKERERLAKIAEEAQQERSRLARIEEDKLREQAERLAEDAKDLAAQGRAEDARLSEETAKKATEDAELASEAAEQIEDEPIVTPSVQIESRAAGLGFGMIDNWKALIIDVDLVPREYMIPDMESLNRLAKAKKGKNPPGGVEFVNETYAKKTKR